MPKRQTKRPEETHLTVMEAINLANENSRRMGMLHEGPTALDYLLRGDHRAKLDTATASRVEPLVTKPETT